MLLPVAHIIDASGPTIRLAHLDCLDLRRDPVAEELRTRRCWQSHLERAQWLSREGYKRILEKAAANRV